MTDKITKIRSDIVIEDKESLPEPDEGVVKSLELLLEKAKTGEIQAIAFIDYWANGAIGHGWDGVFESPSQMLGELRVLEHNYLITSHESAYVAVVEDE